MRFGEQDLGLGGEEHLLLLEARDRTASTSGFGTRGSLGSTRSIQTHAKPFSFDPRRTENAKWPSSCGGWKGERDPADVVLRGHRENVPRVPVSHDGHAPRSRVGDEVRACARREGREALAALLDPQIEFRGLTPSRSWEASTPEEVCEIVFGSWFEPGDHVRETLEADTEPVADRERLHYRLRVESEGADHLVEQQGYYDVVDGRMHA